MDQFSRTRQLLGEEKIKKIQKASIAVFGLGAVGSFAAEALARTGVGNLFLVDFDTVDPTNINRQLYALHSTVGKAKAQLAQKRVLDINPDCQVIIQDTFVNADSLDTLLSEKFDVVVDAIDGLNSKVNLIVLAKQMNLSIVSSMGAAGRTDPAQIRVADISETSVCPLARVVRRRLNRRGVHEGVKTVYSLEKPLNKQPYNEEESVDPLEDHGRKRPPIGTVCWVPGIFGLTLAGLAIDTLFPA